MTTFKLTDDQMITMLKPDERVALRWCDTSSHRGDTAPPDMVYDVFRALGDERARVRELEERVAFAERGRDNAVQQRDEANARSKRKAETAGRIISKLAGLCRACAKHVADLAVRKDLIDMLDALLKNEVVAAHEVEKSATAEPTSENG